MNHFNLYENTFSIILIFIAIKKLFGKNTPLKTTPKTFTLYIETTSSPSKNIYAHNISYIRSFHLHNKCTKSLLKIKAKHLPISHAHSHNPILNIFSIFLLSSIRIYILTKYTIF